MIFCAFALLLTPASEIYESSYLKLEQSRKPVPNLERLVLLADGTKESFYGAYNVLYTNEFPRVQAGNDIFTTAMQKGIIPTKSLAYCSPTLSPIQIVKILENNLIEGVLSAQICLNAIRKELNSMNTGGSTQTQILHQKDTCLSSDIIGLAFRGDISVSGIYASFAPLNLGVPKVKFKRSLYLENLITEHQIFAAWEKEHLQMVLIWYFGQLHLFKRNRGNKMWWPVTKIGAEEMNGEIILDFLRNRLGLFKNLYQKLGERYRKPKSSDFHRQSSLTGQANGNTKLKKLMAEVGTLELKTPPRVTHRYIRTSEGFHFSDDRIKLSSF
ncbi:BgTH12-07646 [Blumeria graminis f. sp. triticale]|uniref:BgTH12-07646 n=1 Tax=Blumeria graminis f. sp. triticale TaxID=1689686 RepID=A0A9W4CX61_BLUGR|nr:BgTH12-07646 [Blumeria graminis f. sp. triticale]